MARPTTAAARGLLACAMVLLFAGQSAAHFPFASFFPAGYVPPIVRIYSGEDPRLNMAACNGEVILVPATYGDDTQLWWKIPPLTSLFDGEPSKYWLVNVATEKAMTSPAGDGELVQLSDFAPFSSDGLQLWVRSASRPEDHGFYQIKPSTDDNMALNGLYGGVHPGTKIAIYHSPPIASNTLWVTSNVFPYPFHY